MVETINLQRRKTYCGFGALVHSQLVLLLEMRQRTVAGIVWRNPLHLAVEMLREKKKGKLEVQYHLQEHSPVDPKTSAWLLALIVSILSRKQ